jgi:hypothetical protein
MIAGTGCKRSMNGFYFHKIARSIKFNFIFCVVGMLSDRNGVRIFW